MSNLLFITRVQPHSVSRPVDKYLLIRPIEPTIFRWLQPCCYCVFEELTDVFALRITTAANELIKCEAYEDSRKGDTTFSINLYFHDAHHYRHIVIPIFVFIQIGPILNPSSFINGAKSCKFLFRVFPILYFSPTPVTHIFFTQHWLIVSGVILNYLFQVKLIRRTLSTLLSRG